MTTRRRLLGAAALASVRPAAAAEWPDRPLTLLVAFAAGGGTDLGARSLARFLATELGQPVGVLNKPGAGGETGFTALARALPDGQTIGIINTPSILSLPIERRTRFRLEDFTPIAKLVDNPCAFYVPADSPFRSLDELVTAARTKPESISYGTTGIGSDDHLAVLEFERMAGVKLLHVPYSGTPQVKQSLLARQLGLAALNLGDAQPERGQGAFRMLGLMAESRSPLAPEVPTFRECGHDVVAGAMRGLAGPAGLPEAIVQRLALAVRHVAEAPEFQVLAAKQMLPLRYLGPAQWSAELTALRARYLAMWNDQPWRD